MIALKSILGDSQETDTIGVVGKLSICLTGELSGFLAEATRNERDRRHLRALVYDLEEEAGPVDEVQVGRFSALFAEISAAGDAAAVVLDASALRALAGAGDGSGPALLMRDLLCAAERTGTAVRVPVTVLADVYDGTPADAVVDQVLGDTIKAVPFDCAIALQVGDLLRARDLGPEHVADASVVATAAYLGGGVIVTGNPDGLASLAREHSSIKILGTR